MDNLDGVFLARIMPGCLFSLDQSDLWEGREKTKRENCVQIGVSEFSVKQRE